MFIQCVGASRKLPVSVAFHDDSGGQFAGTSHGLPESVFLAILVASTFEFVSKTFYHDEVVSASA